VATIASIQKTRICPSERVVNQAGKAVLRDYINATIGFEALGRATGTTPKSLMRMLGPRGNPQASNLFAVLGHLQQQGGFHLKVRTET
jgi:hypothetical protein